MAKDASSRPTQADIARALQISVGAVSMALNGTGTLSKATRERVRSAAVEMGYRPDPLLSALAGRRISKRDAKGTPLTLLVGDGSKHPWQRYREALSEAAPSFGYTLSSRGIGGNASLEKVLRECYHRGVQGIFLMDVAWQPAWRNLDWDRFAVLALRESETIAPVDCVRSGIFQKWVETADRLEAFGRRRIGQVVQVTDPSMRHREDALRYGAAMAARAARGRRWPAPLVLGFEWNHEDRVRLKEYVQKHRCDALLVTLASCVDLLKGMKCVIPGQLSVASSLLSPGNMKAGVAGMVDNTGWICEQAIRIMDLKIRHGDFDLSSNPVQTVVPADWHAGSTV